MSVGPPPRARAIDRLAGRGVDGEHVVAVDAHARHAVGERLDGEGLGGRLREAGVEIAHWLFSQRKTTGTR